MKKVVLLLLAALMCLSFVACDSENEKKTRIDKDSPLVIMYNDEPAINFYRFGECIDEVVELTVENFKDYFDVISYTETVVEKDAFGEVVSTQEVERRILGAKTEKYHRYEEVVIELKNTETDAKTIFDFEMYGKWVEGDLDLDKCECTRIKGRIYFLTLPEEAVRSLQPEWGYECGFVVTDNAYGSGWLYQINPYTKEIHHNGGENWQEKYMTK